MHMIIHDGQLGSGSTRVHVNLLRKSLCAGKDFRDDVVVPFE